jgi:hypothetical protein
MRVRALLPAFFLVFVAGFLHFTALVGGGIGLALLAARFSLLLRRRRRGGGFRNGNRLSWSRRPRLLFVSGAQLLSLLLLQSLLVLDALVRPCRLISLARLGWRRGGSCGRCNALRRYRLGPLHALRIDTLLRLYRLISLARLGWWRRRWTCGRCNALRRSRLGPLHALRIDTLLRPCRLISLARLGWRRGDGCRCGSLRLCGRNLIAGASAGEPAALV